MRVKHALSRLSYASGHAYTITRKQECQPLYVLNVMIYPLAARLSVKLIIGSLTINISREYDTIEDNIHMRMG